jgi:hypothetical protein
MRESIMREMDAMPTDAVVDKVVLALIADIRKGDRQGAQSEYERAQADVMLYSSRARETSDEETRRLYEYAHAGATVRLIAARRPKAVSKPKGEQPA